MTIELFSSPIAFMFHLDTTGGDPWIPLEMMDDYLPEGKNYILARELKPYCHYHCIVDWDTNTYNAFVAKVLRKELGLRGRASKEGPRQYGRVLGIKKPDKMIAYTLKQGVYTSNISEEILKPYKEMSYTKDSGDVDREIREKLKEYIDKVHYNDHFKPVGDEHLKKAIIRFLLKERVRIRTASQIDGYFKYLRQFSSHDYIRKNDEIYFYDLLYNNF